MDSSKWVCGHLTGGLGNRLFQHAAAAGLAEKWQISLVFYPYECEQTNHGPFDTIFRLFPSVAIVLDQRPVQRLPEPDGHVFTYTPFPPSPPANFTSIDGWRQTERYFPSKGIVPDFVSAVGKERCKQLEELYGLTNETKKNTWFIHVRLGDYKVLPHHQIDMADYYSKAVKHIPNGANVLLFSDELTQYGAMLQQLFETLGIQVTPIHLEDELETLYLMSQCWGGAVVANSTFSWWGAYFARNLQAEPHLYKAIYPSKWGNGLPKATDIVPSWGIKIENK